MGYIDFDKADLINLNYSLNRELLRTNRGGSYASSTIIGTNTRKYHGLLVVPQPLIDGHKHVLLSFIGETIRFKGEEFHLGMRFYKDGIQHPKGHKYLNQFNAAPTPRLEYLVGDVKVSKSHIFCRKKDRVLLKYDYEEGNVPVTFRFKPFLAFRNYHALSKANTSVNTKYKSAKNGASWQMYKGYSWLYMQFSRKNEYIHAPDWYYNVEYVREKERGYNYLEDLYAPGSFQLSLKPGESVVISAGLSECEPKSMRSEFNREVDNRIPRRAYRPCLKNAADEFIVYTGKKTEVIAGYPWFGRWGRDTFISLPGLTLTQGEETTFNAVTKTMLNEVKGGLFPNIGHGDQAAYNSVDAPLWFFWSLQQYQMMAGNDAKIWKTYGRHIQKILQGLKNGARPLVGMQDNGLLFAGDVSLAMTWMDAIVNGKPVTPRTGCPVEINALWYNAVMFSLNLAKKAKNQAFVKEWQDVPEQIKKSFLTTFWDDGLGYLADYAYGEYVNWDVRPNMIFAASLPYKMLDESQRHAVVSKVASELLTPRGLRTLSPKNEAYKGVYEGDQESRDKSYHQGTAWPWIIGAYAEAYLLLHGERGVQKIKEIFKGFEPEMRKAGIGTISEIYDGNPPHRPKGAISQAWSVAELLRINWMVKHLDQLMKYHNK